MWWALFASYEQFLLPLVFGIAVLAVGMEWIEYLSRGH